MCGGQTPGGLGEEGGLFADQGAVLIQNFSYSDVWGNIFWFKLPIQYFNWTACLALCNLGTGTFTKGSEGMKK